MRKLHRPRIRIANRPQHRRRMILNNRRDMTQQHTLRPSNMSRLPQSLRSSMQRKQNLRRIRRIKHRRMQHQQIRPLRQPLQIPKRRCIHIPSERDASPLKSIR